MGGEPQVPGQESSQQQGHGHHDSEAMEEASQEQSEEVIVQADIHSTPGL
jgi:hypothetical protein